MSIAERIQLIISSKNLSKRAFGKAIGCTDTAINNIISGRNEPGYKILLGIIQTYDDISPDWLLSGVGEISRRKGTILLPEDQKTLTDVIKILRKENNDLIQKIEEKDTQITNLSKANLLLAESVQNALKNGGVVLKGNNATCADVG